MRSKRVLTIPFITGLLFAATGTGLWPAPAAQGANIPGVDNQGTIKISSVTNAPDPDNEPHPGCPFRVDFFGFRAGTYDVTITGWPPTGGGVLTTDVVTIATTSHGKVLQASRTYDLSSALAGITPQPQQGYHVRLDAKRRGTPGEGSKTKVFWLTCPPAPTPTPTPSVLPTEITTSTPTPTPTPTATLSVGGVTLTPTPTPTPSVSGVTLHKSSTTTAVLGMQITRSSRTQVLGMTVTRGLATTGSPTRAIAWLGALLLGIGSMLTRASRRKERLAR
jgi:hypothetical protein